MREQMIEAVKAHAVGHIEKHKTNDKYTFIVIDSRFNFLIR